MGTNPRRALTRPPRPGAFIIALAILTLLPPGKGHAQDPDPPPPDTIPPAADTLPVEVDVTPGDLPVRTEAGPEDSVPAARFPSFPEGPASGWAGGSRVWEREEILASTAVTLTDFLEQVVGALPIRFGLLTGPEAAAVLGMGGGRMEVLLDGFPLDPLGTSSLDLGGIELISIERIRVDRTADVLRIELETAAPRLNRPYTRIEAGTGEFGTELFRGIILAPGTGLGPLSAGGQRLETQGWQEPGDRTALWAKWSLVRERGALQIEYRRSNLTRDEAAELPGESRRADVILRGRAEPAQGLSVEGFAGRSSAELPPWAYPDPADDLDGGVEGEETEEAEDGASPFVPSLESVRWGGRAGFRRAGVWVLAGFRMQDNPDLPRTQVDAVLGGAPMDYLQAEARLSRQGWREAGSGNSIALRAAATPVPWLRLVGEFGDGRRGVPFSRDSTAVVRLTERTGHRFGAEVEWRRLRVGGAGIGLETDSVAGFGLGFDRGPALYRGGKVAGWEISGSVPLPLDPFSLEGSLITWQSGNTWVYLPVRSWRAALLYDHRPLASGNLHVVGRLEMRQRGSTLLPGDPVLAEEDPTAETEVFGPLEILDFHLQIRILDVRAFLRWENMLNSEGQELFGRPVPPQRILYGVRWQFWN